MFERREIEEAEEKLDSSVNGESVPFGNERVSRWLATIARSRFKATLLLHNGVQVRVIDRP